MWKRRGKGWLLICMVVLILLIGRLMEIQLFRTTAFSRHHINLIEDSVKQRTQQLIIDDGRGSFLDRNGEELTNKKTSVLVLFPFLKKIPWNVERVSKITGISAELLKNAVSKAKTPFAYGKQEPFALTELQMDQINALKIPGVFAIEKKFKRTQIPAEQMVGLVGENPDTLKSRYPDKKLPDQTIIGISGLEASFDEFLLPEGKSKLLYHVDGDGGPLFGLSVKYVDPANPFFPVSIQSTIDKDIQEKAEALADKYHIQKGGLVLLNIQDNSILASVSRPKINKEDPYGSSGMANVMLKQQILGSVFKIVVAAAAIDHNLDTPSRRFDCSKKINGKPDFTYNYGMLDFTNSFARSCNHTFGQLAVELKEINPTIVEDYANRLSLIGPVGWYGDVYHINNFHQLDHEEKGRIFLSDEEKEDKNFVAMTGIGQHEVRATPLAVANMMATIARGGEKKMVRAVSKVMYKNGTTMIDFKEDDLPGEGISPYTVMKLQRLLREVVVNPNGTGKWFNNLPYEVAGKSGTAETGKYQNGKELHNKWFAGYFPYNHPKYALVAVNLDVPGNEGGVNPLFAEMVKMLYQWNNGSH
ncbi:MAG: penicillin-binding transpeptidase domain-containing protein [Bacillota bacterium]|nr:penicillin-binding transpeptidase domain-containing protein [Bacillota bacterium]